jgi:hypothetical protein
MGITMGRQIQRKSLPNYPAQFPGLGGVSFFKFIKKNILKLSKF